MTRNIRGYGAVAGIVAAASAVGVAELVAVASGPRSAPLIAVGGVVVDSVPESLKQFAIDLFGVHDKTALLVGTAVLLAAFAALIGVLAVRWLAVGFAGIGVFAAVGVASALTRPGAGPAAALPSLLGALVAGAVLWRLTALAADGLVDETASDTLAPRRSAEPRTPSGAMAPAGEAGRLEAARAGRAERGPVVERAGRAERGPVARRRFLMGTGVVVGVAAIGGLAGRWLSTRRSVSVARAEVTLPRAASPAPRLSPGTDLKLSQLSPYVTPNETFYRIDTALVVPQVDPADWTLRIHGRVREEITLSYADLLARRMIERYVTLACVSNEVGGRTADGWTCGTPTAVMRDGRDAMLAVGMNGAPLPIEHGFPVRVVVPGLYGYVSACKWVTELELTSFADFDAYWVPRGWSAQGPIKTQSRIDTPRRRNDLAAGPTTVAGVAWAQHTGISKVEVQVDDEPWQQASLAEVASVDTWVQWSWRWDARPGDHVLRVRATDRTGQTQTSQLAPVEPDGATGYHTVELTVT